MTDFSQNVPMDKYFRDRLHNRAKRLVKLVELGAPAHVIGNEIGMIAQAGAGLVGKSVLDFFSGSAARFERWRAGFCTADNCGQKLDNQEEQMVGLCELHIKEQQALFGDDEDDEDFELHLDDGPRIHRSEDDED